MQSVCTQNGHLLAASMTGKLSELFSSIQLDPLATQAVRMYAWVVLLIELQP
jgi:hypothetical protein